MILPTPPPTSSIPSTKPSTSKPPPCSVFRQNPSHVPSSAPKKSEQFSQHMHLVDPRGSKSSPLRSSKKNRPVSLPPQHPAAQDVISHVRVVERTNERCVRHGVSRVLSSSAYPNHDPFPKSFLIHTRCGGEPRYRTRSPSLLLRLLNWRIAGTLIPKSAV